MFKRIGLLLVVNFCVMLSVTLILSFFNISPYLMRYHLHLYDLAIFCLVWGMVGAFVSLALSKLMAKWMLNVRTLSSESSLSLKERQYVDMVYRLSQMANLPAVPEIGIFPSPIVNAFATGPTKRHSLVAVSSRALEALSFEELEAVVGHELTHIQNGDMVTATLLQGIVNAFVMFLSRVLAYALSGMQRNSDSRSNSSYMTYYLLTGVFQTVFLVFGSLLLCWFSRRREFVADRGGASLSGKKNMIAALRSLDRLFQEDRKQQPALQMLFITPKAKSMWRLFMTHPSIEERIQALEAL